MRVVIKDNYDALAYWTASYIKNKIMQNIDKKIVLGLPTGSTPLQVYKYLIDFYKNNELTFKHVVTFNMDEYIGLDKTHNQSYHYFMYTNFFNHIDIIDTNIHILNGMAENLEQECIDYENLIKAHGGIDLMLGGIGTDGHIAFNEPGSSLNSLTRIKTLNDETIESNARFFKNSQEVPKMALTIGIKTIMDSNEVIIIASGYNKAKAIEGSIENPISHICPGSALQNHEKACFVIDNQATNELKVKTVNYFKGLQKSIDYQGKPILKNLNNHIGKDNKILIFSPHPDDDVIGMGCAINHFTNIADINISDINVAYMTSGENGISSNQLNKLCREQEAINAIQTLGLDRTNALFLRLPFYKSSRLIDEQMYDYQNDVEICYKMLCSKQPTDIFVCSDKDPNGTHQKCFNILQKTFITHPELSGINVWLYKGAWGYINNSNAISLPITKDIMDLKLISIKQHLSQYPPKFPGSDDRSFDQRVIDYNKSNIMFGEFEEKFEKLTIDEFIVYEFDN